MLGSKIENLKILKEHNINVPDFFVITNDSYQKKEKYLNNLQTKLYAVRSSCSLEDGTTNSFAGQFDTYLNVKEKDLDKYIKKCFDSINNQNVKDYIKNNNIKEEIQMNCIVQKMINSRVSGVLFTANPQGILNETVIVTSLGLGENVVQDKGETTSYYYNNTDKIYYYEGKDILTKEEIEKLIEESNKIKEILGDYLDIEFAFEENELYILQARKITTIDDSNILVMDNSNIVESYPGISLPLTISFVNNVYSSVFKNLVKRVLKDEQELQKLNQVFNNMTGSVNGRLYYKISNWYTLLNFLPFSNKIIPIWQEMLGVKTKKITTNDIKVKKFTKIKIMFNYLKELIKVNKNMNQLNKDFLLINNEFKNKFNENLNTNEILKLYSKIEKELLNNWDITLINDMYAFIYTGLLKNHLKKKHPEDYTNITNSYISGISNIESLKPIREILKLALSNRELSKEDFQKQKEIYIDLYGDRSLEELKLESKTFRTNPELLDKKIKEYQTDLTRLNNLYKDLTKEQKTTIKEDIITKHYLNKVTKGISNREISRLNRSRIYGMVRSMFLTIGNNLVREKIIDNRRDIFYLKLEEIKNINIDINYKLLIKERKEEYKHYEILPSYSRLIFMKDEFNKTNKNINKNIDIQNDEVIYGTPCSQGLVEGEVLVVDDINNIKDVKDKILVTKMTDPGWVFLLATAKGVISEKGSLLSHTAIISRELKIPSIVGVDNILSKLKTNDIIKMDANTGRIEIIKRSKS